MPQSQIADFYVSLKKILMFVYFHFLERQSETEVERERSFSSGSHSQNATTARTGLS